MATELTETARAVVAASREADRTLDADGFRRIFTEQVEFQIGALPLQRGVEDAVSFIAGFFARLTTMEHRIHRSWQIDQTVIYEATVQWHLTSGEIVADDYVNVIDLEGDRARRYRIYIDTVVLG